MIAPELLDDPSLDAEFLHLDGKDEFGDLLDFDPNENFIDLDIKAELSPPPPVSKGNSSKKVGPVYFM